MQHQWAGQATFFPFDALKVKPVDNKFSSFAKGAWLAVDEPAAKRVMRWKLPSSSLSPERKGRRSKVHSGYG
jgi:hypothetical protein